MNNVTHSYVSWGSVLAGTVAATAVSVVLLQFGSAVGLASTINTDTQTLITAGGFFTVAFWLLWIQILASLLGGYMAGRLRQAVDGANPHEVEVRDGAHGLLVWATGTLAVFVGASLVAAFAALAPEAVPTVVNTPETPELLANRETASVLFAFCAGASSLVSAVVAWFAATKGGDHRDNAVDLSRELSFKR